MNLSPVNQSRASIAHTRVFSGSNAYSAVSNKTTSEPPSVLLELTAKKLLPSQNQVNATANINTTYNDKALQANEVISEATSLSLDSIPSKNTLSKSVSLDTSPCKRVEISSDRLQVQTSQTTTRSIVGSTRATQRKQRPAFGIGLGFDLMGISFFISGMLLMFYFLHLA